ncbi:hypothetical protein SAMN02910414_01260 [Lachnobacterium bovis DSM 14045]|uniref:Uncharacterized protein n=1 Tax=Lachnobacterium bovis DSM 14045 TaxID=1122142 RepID=A0A1H3IUS5_9FIRM|nr:hypothetical protein SAMN02910414_01260 [Lachnobacterium bovis DSM 14045]
MKFIKKNSIGILVCFLIALPSLILAFLLRKVMKIPKNTSTLIGVGSSI